MNVQTEKIENHIARLTVEIEPTQFDKAKKKAAKKLARYVNIPGFRKGKAPYNILVNYIGEGPILEEAIEDLGNDIYREALGKSEIEPYTSGELADFQLDPKPTFVFTVPMQPTVDMGDYRKVRVDYEPPTLEEEDFEDVLRNLQRENALIEESQHPAKMGDRIVADLHGFFTDDEDQDDDDEADADTEETPDTDATDDDEVEDHHEHDDDDNDHDHDDLHNAPIHEHDATIYLDEQDEPVPGFSEALVGVEPEQMREFTLTYPADADKYGEAAGREVRFVVEIHEVENVTLPELNDAFAERLTEEEDEPLTMLQLRERIRENMQRQLEQEHRSEYISKVMDQMMERATFAYPEIMIHSRIDDMLREMVENYGFDVDDYMRLIQKSREDMYADEVYRDSAENFIKRSLIMRGILDEEGIEVPEARIDEHIEEGLAQFDEDQQAGYRSLFENPQMRENVRNSLLEEMILERIVEIGRGEVPDVATSSDEILNEAAGDTETADAVDLEEDESEPNEA